MSQKRKQLCLEQKLDILKRFKSGERAVDIERNLGLAPSTIKLKNLLKPEHRYNINRLPK